MNIENISDKDLYIMCTEMMLDMGIPAHLRGYAFIREAIVKTVRNPVVTTSITKNIYPEIARIYRTTDQKVERAIRNAVEISWARGNDITEKKLFGYTRDDGIRPTNSEYISQVADKIRLDIKSISESV